MKKKVIRNLKFFLVFLFLVFTISRVLGATNIDACQTLNSANEVYILNKSVNSSETCFTISADNITLDCAGYEINYSHSGIGNRYGVYASWVDNITIKNCIVKEGVVSGTSKHGIYLSNINFGNILNNTIYGIGTSSVSLSYRGYDTNITNNTLYTTDYQAISGTGDRNLLNNNLINSTDQSTYAVWLSSGENCTFYNNTINSYYYTAFSSGIDNGNITSNEIYYHGGTYSNVQFDRGNNNVVENNIFLSYGGGSSLVLSYSNNNTFYNNLFHHEGSSRGLYFQRDNDNNIFDSNQISSKSNNAFEFGGTSSNNNTFINNNFTTNSTSSSYFAIKIEGSANNQNIFVNNTLSTLSHFGLFLSGTIDSDYNQTFNEYNIINEKPLNFTYDVDNLIYDEINFSQYGQIIFAGVDNLTIKNSNFSENGLDLYYVSNSTFENNSFMNEKRGIYFKYSNNNLILNNIFNISNIDNNMLKILEFSYSHNNLLKYNNFFSASSTMTGIYSIYSDYSDNITLKHNDFESEGSYDAIRILRGENGLIYNNTVYHNGSSTSYGFYLNQIPHLNFSSNNIYGIGGGWGGVSFDIISYGTINNNLINGSLGDSSRCMMISDSDNNTFFNNTLFKFGGSGDGILLFQSENNLFEDIKISSADYGIYIDRNSNNITFLNLNINTVNDPGIYFLGDNNNITFKDIIFSTISSSYDFYVRSTVDSGEWNLTNVTKADGSPIDVYYDASASGTLNYFNYINAYTNDSSGDDLENVNVSLYKNNLFYEFVGLTNSSGWLRELVISWFQNDSSGKQYPQYNLSTSKVGYVTQMSSLFNMSEEKFLYSELPLNLNVTLNSPQNYSWSNSALNNFNCSVTSELPLVNMTLYVNFSGTWIENETKTISGISNTSVFSINLNDGTYIWNCLGYNNIPISSFAEENYTLFVDTTLPFVDYGYNVETNNSYKNQNFIFINISIIEINQANLTFYLYNESSLINQTTFNNTTQEINFTSLSEGVYYYNVTVIDLATNTNSTETRKIILDTTLPIIESTNYSPNLEDDVDPETQINVTTNITEINVNYVYLQYKNSTSSDWTNTTMSLISGLYEGNFITSSEETNYSFRIFVEDLAGNINYTTETNFSSYWDCSWTLTPTNLEEVIGYYETKYIGNVTVSNTGDTNYSSCVVEYSPNFVSNSLSVDYYASSNFPSSGRGLTFSPSGDFVLNTNQEKNLSVSIYLPTVESPLQEEPRVIITSNITDTVTDETDKYTNTTVVISQPGPYLYQEINSYPTVVPLVPSNFTLNSSLKNLAGDNTDTNTAHNVSFNWTINTNLISYSLGNRTLEYENLTNNSEIVNILDFNFTSTNLENFPDDLVGESIEFKTYLYGYDNNSNLITHAENTTYLQETFSISFICDPDEITNTAPACKPTTVTETVTTSSGGGGGGGSSPIARQSDADFELVTGEKQEFTLPIENEYPYPIKNVVVTVSGINADYVKIIPETIKEIKPNSTYNVTIKITAPAYFTEGTHDLTFKVKGEVDLGTTNSYYTDTKYVSLFILEVDRETANKTYTESQKLYEEMNQINPNNKDIQNLMNKITSSYENIEFNALTSSYEELKTIYIAFTEYNEIYKDIQKTISKAQENGIEIFEAHKLVSLAQAAYDRGKYVLALERIKEASLTLAVEIKGEFNLLFLIKNNPLETVIALFGLLFFGIGGTYSFKYTLYKKKIKLLNQEEKLLFELMKVVQRECFKHHRMSMDEYSESIIQYEKRLGLVIEGRIKTESKLRNLFKTQGKKKALTEEKDKVSKKIMDLQDKYLNKGTIETRLYENMLRTYSTRLAEVEEELTFIEAQEHGVKVPKRKRK